MHEAKPSQVTVTRQDDGTLAPLAQAGQFVVRDPVPAPASDTHPFLRLYLIRRIEDDLPHATSVPKGSKSIETKFLSTVTKEIPTKFNAIIFNQLKVLNRICRQLLCTVRRAKAAIRCTSAVATQGQVSTANRHLEMNREVRGDYSQQKCSTHVPTSTKSKLENISSLASCVRAQVHTMRLRFPHLKTLTFWQARNASVYASLKKRGFTTLLRPRGPPSTTTWAATAAFFRALCSLTVSSTLFLLALSRAGSETNRHFLEETRTKEKCTHVCT